MASPNQLSFLPDDYLERKIRRRTTAFFGALFLIVVCAIGAALMWKERCMREMEKQKAELDVKMAEAAKPIEQFKQMQEKQRTLAHQAELTASLLEKVPRSFLLAEITNGIPAGVSLLDFTLESKVKHIAAPAPKTAFEQRKAEVQGTSVVAGVPVAQPRVYEVSMKLTGVASTDVQVAQFISKLNRSSLLKDVNLLISDEFVQNNEKLRRFQIEMLLNPEAQVSPAEKKTNSTAAVPLSN